MDSKKYQKISKHTLNLPDEIWHNIPENNHTQFITKAIEKAIQEYGQHPYANHTNQQPVIDELNRQIEELKKDKDYLKYMALPFWKRWRIPKLMPPQEKY